MTLEDDNVEVATSVTSVAAPTVTPAPLVLPGLPPAAVEALRSPPAGRYVYNVPVYMSNSPLAMPSTLQRVLNFEPVEVTLPGSSLLEPPVADGFETPIILAPTSPTSPSHSPLLAHGPTSPPTPVEVQTEIAMPLADARAVDLLAITNGFEPRVEQQFDSDMTLTSDSSYTLGSEDSPRSGESQEYEKGTTTGMDMYDPFVDDSDIFGPL